MFSVHFPFSSFIHSANIFETHTGCWTHGDELGKIPPSTEVETHRGISTHERTVTVHCFSSHLTHE